MEDRVAPLQQVVPQDIMEDVMNLAPEREPEDSPSGTGWSLVDAQGISPRSLHAAAVLHNNLYVFGGYDGVQRVNSFFAYSFHDKRWSPVLPSTVSAHPPAPRDRHVMIAYGNSIYVQGGFDGVSRINDMWAFHFDSNTWREIIPLQGSLPSPRHSHSAVVWQHKLVIACGYDGSYKNDVHMFDFTTSSWTEVRTQGRKPRSRYRASAVVWKNYLILFGGHDGTRHLSDTHILDLENNNTWSTLVTTGTPPMARDSHVACLYQTSMYIFGGSSGAALNDLMELQLPSRNNPTARWRRIPATAGAYQPRHRFCHTGNVYGDSWYIFGGYDGNSRLSEFAFFNFAVYDLSFDVPESTLVPDLRAHVNDPTFSDVKFVVEDQEIYAHKIMLTRCSYFQSLFLGNMKESAMSSISIEQVRYPTFLWILEYLYTDTLQISTANAMELFEAADLFHIPRLQTMCEKRMLQSITHENAAYIFYTADLHSAGALRAKARKYILANFELVSKTESFQEMGRQNVELVFELLQSR